MFNTLPYLLWLNVNFILQNPLYFPLFSLLVFVYMFVHARLQFYTLLIGLYILANVRSEIVVY